MSVLRSRLKKCNVIQIVGNSFWKKIKISEKHENTHWKGKDFSVCER